MARLPFAAIRPRRRPPHERGSANDVGRRSTPSAPRRRTAAGALASRHDDRRSVFRRPAAAHGGRLRAGLLGGLCRADERARGRARLRRGGRTRRAPPALRRRRDGPDLRLLGGAIGAAPRAAALAGGGGGGRGRACDGRLRHAELDPVLRLAPAPLPGGGRREVGLRARVPLRGGGQLGVLVLLLRRRGPVPAHAWAAAGAAAQARRTAQASGPSISPSRGRCATSSTRTSSSTA